MEADPIEPLDYAVTRKRSGPPVWGIALLALAFGCVGVLLLGNEQYFPFLAYVRPSRVRCCGNNRLRSAVNLKSIFQACLLYSNDYHYQMPPDQAAMVLTQDIGPDCFLNLRSDTVIPTSVGNARDIAAEAAWVQACSDYEYLGGGLDIRKIPADLIVAYERHLTPTDATYGRNALFGDGHVDWLTQKEFDAQRARTQSRLTAMRMGSMWLRVGRW
jgi:prepilin-type processing-associated H-X9-DG protein